MVLIFFKVYVGLIVVGEVSPHRVRLSESGADNSVVVFVNYLADEITGTYALFATIT